MFGSLKALISDLTNAGTEHFEDDDHRLATAALCVHLISIDGEVTEDEHKMLRTALMKQYGLTSKETDSLVKDAEIRDREAVDLYSFTKVLKRNLDEDGRARIVELLWQLVYADGVVHEFEDNIVWRVAELLGISTRRRMLLKKRVATGDKKD
ncbi:MAG: TerB family tellurite resistance protein [Cohaesibacteraceae bacterium]|nr:TerB family tellurite resistance protein [Cohaesibacteraceae bacterium]